MKLRVLATELSQVAATELNEYSDEETVQGIKTVKEWLQKQPHLPDNIDDQWILSYLRGCKHSLERTKEKLDIYYTARSLYPEFFANRDPLQPQIQELLRIGSSISLPEPDIHGRRVTIIRHGLNDPRKFSLTSIMKVNFMAVDLRVKDDDRAVVAGVIVVVDLKDVSLGHVTELTPSIAKKIATVQQDAYPMRPKAFHFINVPPRVDKVFNMFKSFMNKKQQKRIYTHGSDIESLYKHVPQEILPVEYGGNGGSWSALAGEQKSAIERNRDWFIRQERIKSDEKRRPTRTKQQTNTFGVEGSFRKLNLD